MLFKDLATVFISYRETNADQNWELLSAQNPNAKRVHGVKGFDAAHKAARRAFEFDQLQNHTHVITVDGDNEVFPEFWSLDTRNIPSNLTPAYTDGVLSWNSYNPVTGLYYGNGGLKLWSFKFLDSMTTHELTSGDSPVVDFCWDKNYVQLSHIYSTTRTACSMEQAFTAGFREGSKMPLREGKITANAYETAQSTYKTNLARLISWCSIGAHHKYGDDSIYGALSGFWYVSLNKSVLLHQVSDIDFLYELSHDNRMKPEDLRSLIRARSGIVIPTFGPVQSQFIVDRTRPTNTSLPFERETWMTPLDIM